MRKIWGLLFVLFAVSLPAFSQEEEALAPVVVGADEKVVFQWEEAFASKVEIGGSFNGFDPPKTPLARGTDGVWRGQISLAEGKHEYKFVVDGQWEQGDNRKLVLVRGKGAKLEVLPEVPTFNTPYNSRIFFSGRLFGQTVIRNVPGGEGVDTGRTRLAPLEYNLMPRMAFSAGDKVTGFLELDINDKENRFQAQISEARATLTEDWGRLFIFRRTRAIDFNNPLRSLDRFRDTLDDNVYFTTEERPPEHWFGRQFDQVRQSGANPPPNYTYRGWQGGVVDFKKGRWNLIGLGAANLTSSEDLWAFRGTWDNDFIRIGSTFVHNEKPRGLIAARSGGNSIFERSPFYDTSGVINYPPGTGDYPNYDALVHFEPNGHNRDQWWAVDARLGSDTRYLFGELQGRRKDWSFAVFENGDGLQPDGTAHYTNAPNFGEYLAGGRERELSAIFGGTWFVTPRLGFEMSYKMDDGTALTINNDRNVVNVEPSGGTFTGKARYRTDKWAYGFEMIHRTVRDFPNTVFEEGLDNYNFSGVNVIGADNLLTLKQDIALKLGKWGVSAAHRFRRYDLIASSPLETNELRGVLSYDLDRRWSLALGARYKSYGLPTNPRYTSNPAFSDDFLSWTFRTFYKVSKYVRLNVGLGVNYENDEDVEEGRLFFLRDALAQARRPHGNASPATHTLDQVIDAERILSRERRFEINLDAKF